MKLLSCSDKCKSAFIRGSFSASTALLFVAATFVLSVQTARSQTPIRDYRRAHERQIIDEFTRLLAIPNIASDTPNIRRNAQFILEMMQRRGLNPRLLEARSKDTPPAVYGEWKVAGAPRSIILYAHYDGQPVDPKQWTASPPFQPTWRSAAGSILSCSKAGRKTRRPRFTANGKRRV